MSQIPAKQDYHNSQEFYSQVQNESNKSSGEEDHSKKMAQIEEQLSNLYKKILNSREVSEISAEIKEYCIILVANNCEDLYINSFVESNFMGLINEKLKQYRNSSEFLKSVFSLFEFLLKALKREEDLIYFLIKINQEGFISSTYNFQQEEDIAYYANFLKLMIRKINEHQKYLSVFFNIRQPHFPLLLKLLKFYDCPDVVMHTSSKLAIMEITSNKNPFVQKYVRSFPFIIFYPLYVGIILDTLKKAVYQQKNQIHLENLENHLKFMEEFISNKDREAVDIYTNVFLKTIGLFIYSQLSNITQKSIKRVKKIYKILLKHVLPELSVIKIKTSLLLLFNTDISCKMKKCFSGKPVSLETNHWILDVCLNEIIEHCKKVFYYNEPSSKSIFKIINSYIPRSKDNWLYYEMIKIGELIGFNVPLLEPINYDDYLSDSFLKALWTMIDDKFQPNQIFGSLQKIKDQELLYYHLKALNILSHCYNHEIRLNMDAIVQQMSICNSLSLVQIFYIFVLKNKLHFQDSPSINQIYENIIDKLTHFIMTKGMKEFLIRVKDSRIKENDEKYFMDIYREVQCEILLFAAIRSLLGFPNEEGSKFDIQKWDSNSSITSQITFRCRGLNSAGPELTMILDGQYLKIRNKNQHLIHKDELMVQNVRFYEQKDTIVLNGNEKTNNYSTTICIQDEIKCYLLKEINNRKDLAIKIGLIIKQMQFQFNY